eukprot:1152901-Pelagomonas_calceolata.AAC.21
MRPRRTCLQLRPRKGHSLAHTNTLPLPAGGEGRLPSPRSRQRPTLHAEVCGCFHKAMKAHTISLWQFMHATSAGTRVYSRVRLDANATCAWTRCKASGSSK